MYKIKIFISFLIFSTLLIITSIIKNQTREIEKNIFYLSNIIHQKEKDFNESYLDFSYLTSPDLIDNKIDHLDNEKYIIMEYSNIYLDMSEFIDLKKKFVTQEKNEKKTEKK